MEIDWAEIWPLLVYAVAKKEKEKEENAKVQEEDNEPNDL